MELTTPLFAPPCCNPWQTVPKLFRGGGIVQLEGNPVAIPAEVGATDTPARGSIPPDN
jgi:hypothetical protein